MIWTLRFGRLYPLRCKPTQIKSPTDKHTLKFVQKHPCLMNVNTCESTLHGGRGSHVIKTLHKCCHYAHTGCMMLWFISTSPLLSPNSCMEMLYVFQILSLRTLERKNRDKKEKVTILRLPELILSVEVSFVKTEPGFYDTLYSVSLHELQSYLLALPQVHVRSSLSSTTVSINFTLGKKEMHGFLWRHVR